MRFKPVPSSLARPADCGRILTRARWAQSSFTRAIAIEAMRHATRMIIAILQVGGTGES
jgi:hypothetical protein